MVHQGLKRRFGAPLLALLALMVLAGCLRPTPGTLPAISDTPPPAPREFRAAWVATVANIDWPSSSKLSTEAQKAEARALVQRARELGLNTLILQVRPAADALYADLLATGVDVILDDRNERPGAMFADWELIGVPHRITLGDRGLKEGMVEYQHRRDAAATSVPVGEIAALVRSRIRV